jgi:large subunit ribosomal protein L23
MAKIIDTANTTSTEVKSTSHLHDVLKNPRITEKTARATELNSYTFDVDPRTTKNEIKKAFDLVYQKKPIKVMTIVMSHKKVKSRKGATGTKAGGKKAVITLAKGETISFLP